MPGAQQPRRLGRCCQRCKEGAGGRGESNSGLLAAALRESAPEGPVALHLQGVQVHNGALCRCGRR